MFKPTISIAAAGLLLLPDAAAAHPGHGVEHGTLHFLADPFHLVGAVLVTAAAVALVALAGRLSLWPWRGR